MFNALKQAVLQHILPNPRYITHESNENTRFSHYIHVPEDGEYHDRIRAGLQPVDNREDFKHIVEFQVTYIDTRFLNMQFGIQMMLALTTGNPSANTLIVGMLRESEIYFNIDNPLYFEAMPPAGTAAMPQRAIDKMLKYFTFFIDECGVRVEIRSILQAQAEWNAFLDWKINHDDNVLKVLALAMATNHRLGAEAPVGLREFVNTRLLGEAPGTFGNMLGEPPPEAGRYKTQYEEINNRLRSAHAF